MCPTFTSGVRRLLLFLALLGCAAGGPRRSQAQAPPRLTVVLLYDGKLPAQAELDAAAREAFKAQAEKVELRTMHAGRAETVPFLRKHNLTRENAPVLLVLDEPGPRARIVRRIPLDPEATAGANVRIMLSALRLKAPRVEPPAPGPVVTVLADGGAEEAKYTVRAVGTQQVEAGVRRLEAGSSVIYRLPVPEALRNADLRAELGGNYAVDWADNPEGPWSPLMDSYLYFGPTADKIPERTRPVVPLTPLLGEKIKNSLYLRVRGNGRSGGRAVLASLQVVALGMGEESAEKQWVLEADRLRKGSLASLPPGALNGTPVAGTLAGNTVWAAKSSPYLMTGDVTIPFGARLTIEAGVSVRVVGRSALRVNGDLEAKGTAEKPVEFRPVVPRQPDDWLGLLFYPLPGAESGKSSVLEYCRITNAAAVELRRFGGEVRHCSFERGTAGVILRDGGSGKLHHNRFERCAEGLVLAGGGGGVSQSEWVDCMVALAVREVNPKVPFRFENNSIAGSRVAGVQYTRLPNQPRPALALANNHWTGTAPAQLIGRDSAEVSLEPQLPARPEEIGPGFRPATP